MNALPANQSLLAVLFGHIHGFVTLDSVAYAAERSAHRDDADVLSSLRHCGLLDENQSKLIHAMAEASVATFGSADSAIDNSPPLRTAFEQLHEALARLDRDATQIINADQSTDHGGGPKPRHDSSSKAGGTVELPKRPALPLLEPRSACQPDQRVSAMADYTLEREHAHGGLGEVFLAWDKNLERSVAVKRIQWAHHGDSQLQGRFLREAQITAKLEHPSIVPVHTIGIGPDGRAFYVMRMIQGETLRSAIEQFHQSRPAAWTSGISRIELRRLLSRFVDVCNAISYAHSHGVIHRDIKPANIMLGTFGETFVVDWGLAKVLTSAAPELRELGGPVAGAVADGSYTQFGSAIGTTFYMSPEQAAGNPEQLGPASDIYNLGATLYEILTGRPPFADCDPAVILSQIQQGAYRAPREFTKSISPKLEAICRKAMAITPKDRYPSTSALAADIESWLADEPIRARRESATERAMRWTRKHSALVTGLSALLVSAVLALGAGVIFVNTERQRTESAREAAQRNFVEAQNAREVAEESRRDAVAAEGMARLEAERANQEAQRANAETMVAKATSDFVIGLFRSSDPFNRGRLAPAVFDASNRHLTARQILDHAAEDIPVALANYPDAQAEMMAVVGDVLRRLSSYDKARSLLESALAIQRKRLKPTDPAIATTLRSLAQWHLNQRTFQEAEPLLQESLRIVEANSPVDADTMLSTRLNIIWALMATRRLEEAKQEAAKIHALLVEKLGKDSIELRVLTSLLTAEIDDTVRMVQNQFIRAFAELSRDDLTLLLSLLKRLVLAQLLGDANGLEKALGDIRRETRRMLGDRNWTEPFLILYAADTAETRGDLNAAKAQTLAAMDLAHQVYGDGSVWSTSFDYQAGRRLARLQAYPEAEMAFRASIHSAQGTVLVNAYQDYVLRVYCDLLSVLVKTGQVEKRNATLAEIRRLRSECPDRHSQGLAHSFMMAGRSLVEAGKHEEAAWILEESVRTHDFVRKEIRAANASMRAEATRDRFREALLAVLDVDTEEDVIRFASTARALLAEVRIQASEFSFAEALLEAAIHDYESVTPRGDDEIVRMRSVAVLARQLSGRPDPELRERLLSGHPFVTSSECANRALLAIALTPLPPSEQSLARSWLASTEKKKVPLDPAILDLVRWRLGDKTSQGSAAGLASTDAACVELAAVVQRLASPRGQEVKDRADEWLRRLSAPADGSRPLVSPPWVPRPALEQLLREVVTARAN